MFQLPHDIVAYRQKVLKGTIKIRGYSFECVGNILSARFRIEIAKPPGMRETHFQAATYHVFEPHTEIHGTRRELVESILPFDERVRARDKGVFYRALYAFTEEFDRKFLTGLVTMREGYLVERTRVLFK